MIHTGVNQSCLYEGCTQWSLCAVEDGSLHLTNAVQENRILVLNDETEIPRNT